MLDRLLKERLELEDKEYDYYFKLLTMKFNDKRVNNLLNYFKPKDKEETMARIKSKRLQKSLDEIVNPQDDSDI